MRKKVTTLILAAVITAAVSVPAWACTPRLDLKMPDLQSAYDSAYEAGKNAAKDIKIPDSYFKTETESEPELETETAAETESETVMPGKLYLDWSKYIPESFRNRWKGFVRR